MHILNDNCSYIYYYIILYIYIYIYISVNINKIVCHNNVYECELIYIYIL